MAVVTQNRFGNGREGFVHDQIAERPVILEHPHHAVPADVVACFVFADRLVVPLAFHGVSEHGDLVFGQHRTEIGIAVYPQAFTDTAEQGFVRWGA